MQSGSASADKLVNVARDFSDIPSALSATAMLSACVLRTSVDVFPSAEVDSLDSMARKGGREDNSGATDVDGVSGGESWRNGDVAPPAIPPTADSPARSRCALHALYVMVGNRSLTSSNFKSFFSRRLRWTGWFNPTKGWRVAKSTSSSNCAPRRFRWEYRKQYLTPTMILNPVKAWSG